MADKAPKWIKHSSKVVHENKWFKVLRDEVTRPTGERSEYNFVVNTPVVFIVPQNSDGSIYLIGQHRYPVDKYSMEIPAGRTDGEEPLNAAKRELQEETGFVAKKWEKLGEFYSANGLLREKAHVYLATELTQTGKNEQEEEGIDKVVKLPLEKILEMIRSGEIHDGQTISSLMLYLTAKGLL
ncbi:MAG TPA: NUDIX hydrolase [Candidatus Saccharimonadales bacterium]|nr:NUDIX hydrolase [Candidatus Saccharimonadales bacterium]